MTSPFRTTHRVIAGVALTGAAVLATACSSGGPSATPTKTVTVTASARASSAPPSPTPPAAGPAPSAAGPAPCPTRSLGAKIGPGQGAAGSVYVAILFTNISNVTCTLYGYPGVSLAGGSPITQIGLAAAENPATSRVLVTLPPGAVAHALLRIVNAGVYPAAKCGPVTAKWLQIYPPNQTTPMYLRYTSQACSKPVALLTVDAVRPGSGG